MKLKHNYDCIVAWGRMQGSYPYYIQNQCIQANQDGAPEDVIFQKRNNQGYNTSEWNRLRDVESPETQHWFKSNYPQLVEKFTDWNKQDDNKNTAANQRPDQVSEAGKGGENEIAQ